MVTFSIGNLIIGLIGGILFGAVVVSIINMATNIEKMSKSLKRLEEKIK